MHKHIPLIAKMASSVDNTPTSSSFCVRINCPGTDSTAPEVLLEHSFSVFKTVVDNHLSLSTVKSLLQYLEKTQNYVDGKLQQVRLLQVEQEDVSSPTLQPELPVSAEPEVPENISAAPPVEPAAPDTAVTKPAKRNRPKKHTPVVEPTEVAEPEDVAITGYGLKTREQFSHAYQRVAHRVQAALVSKLGTVLYPTVCTRMQCTLCLSWYLYTAITPCHPRYHCKSGGCYTGYNAHTTPNGLKLLKKYHSRIHQFPVHVCEPPVGPEYENSLSETTAFSQYYHVADAGTKKILETIGDLNAIAAEVRKNGVFEPCSSGEETDDAIATPLAVREPARKKRSKSIASAGSGTTSSAPMRKKK